jgi:general stress protein 26
MIRDMHVAMLTTCSADGSLRSRPMLSQSGEIDGDLWFFTEEDSPKTFEIRRDQRVNLSYCDVAHSRYVSVSGRASIVRDDAKARQLWSEGQRVWYPNGPEDPKLALLRVTVEHAEYWDAQSASMVQLLGLPKVLAAGRRYDPGEDEKADVELREVFPPPGEALPRGEGTNYSHGEEHNRWMQEE